MRSPNRKIHLRIINRDPKAMRQFGIPCGVNVCWTRDTTSDTSKVTCLRCLKHLTKIPT